MCLKVLPFEERKPQEKLDLTSSLLFMIGMTCLLLALNYGAVWHWLSSRTLITASSGMLILLLFYFWEIRSDYPILDLSLLRHRSFFAGNILSFLLLAILIMNMILLPFYLQQVLDQSPAVIGLFIFIPPLFIMLIAPLSSYFAEKIGLFKLITAGLIIVLLGWIVQLFYNSNTSFGIVILAQTLFGIGYGIFQPLNSYSILHTIPLEKMGVSSGLASFTKNVSKMVGIAFCVSICQSFQLYYSTKKHIPFNSDPAFLFGYKAMIISAIFLMLVTVWLAYWQFKPTANT
jgi:MFS family permease